MLEERPNIKIVSLKPKVLQFVSTQKLSSSSESASDLSGTSDIYDTQTNNHSTEKTKINDNFENDVESNLSYMPDRSDSDEEEETIKGFQMSAKGPIYEITEEQFKEMNGEQNQG